MIVGFSGLAWITPLYLELGSSEQEAANLFVLFQVVQLVTMLTLPALTDHTTDRRPLLALVVVSSIVGIALLLAAPVGLAIPAMTLFGMGVGGGSTLGLVLIMDTTRTQSAAARLGAMCLLVAFLSGALGPFVLGALSDLTGELRTGYAVMLALSFAVLLVVARLVPGRFVDDEAAARSDRTAASEGSTMESGRR
jgi:MFS transporter, CP family, cyanate transporter